MSLDQETRVVSESEQNVANLRQISSLVAQFQQEAQNEKESRVQAQIQAQEKDRLASEAWRIISALKHDKQQLEVQVERMQCQNEKLMEAVMDGGESSKPVPLVTCTSVNSEENPPCNSLQGAGGIGIKAALTEILKRGQILGGGKQDKTNTNNEKRDLTDKQLEKKFGHKNLQAGIVAERTRQLVRKLKLELEAQQKQTENKKEKTHSKAATTIPEKSVDLRHATPGVCGLENLGNTCFVNAALQCLFAVRPFCRYFLGGGAVQPRATGKRSEKSKISSQLAQLISKVWSGNYLACDPSDFYKAFLASHPQFKHSKQHDCQEFLALLLDSVHQELIMRTADNYDKSHNKRLSTIVEADQWWRLYSDRHKSIIVDTFQGQFRSRVTCQGCGHVSVTHQSFTFLSLPLPETEPRTFYPILVRNPQIRQDERSCITRCRFGKRKDWLTKTPQFTGRFKVAVLKRFKVQLSAPCRVHQLKQQVISLLSGDNKPSSESLVAGILKSTGILRTLADDDKLDQVRNTDSFYVFEPVRMCDTSTLETDNYLHKSIASLLEPKHKDVSQRYKDKRRASLPVTSTPMTSVRGREGRRISLPGASTQRYTCSECSEERTAKEMGFHQGRVTCLQCIGAKNKVPGLISNVQQVEQLSPSKFRTLTIPVLFVTGHSQPGMASITPSPGIRSATHRCFPVKRSKKKGQKFSHPLLASVPEKVKGQDVEQFVNTVLQLRSKSGAAELNLSLINEQGKRCSRFPCICLCTCCQVKPDDVISFLSGDHLIVSQKSLLPEPEEHLPHCVDHESVTKKAKKSASLTDCLECLVNRDMLDTARLCPQCDQHKTASKTLSICRLPDTLIIHLKRYNKLNAKLTTPVDYPLELNLRSFVAAYTKYSEGEGLYDLVACVSHQGDISGGHYTTCSRNSASGPWRQYDDGIVTQMQDGPTDCAGTVYLLFYRQRAGPPLNLSRTESIRVKEDNPQSGKQLSDRMQKLLESKIMEKYWQDTRACNGTKLVEDKPESRLLDEQPRESLANHSNRQGSGFTYALGSDQPETNLHPQVKCSPGRVHDKLQEIPASHKKKRKLRRTRRSGKHKNREFEPAKSEIQRCGCDHCQNLQILEKQFKEVRRSTGIVSTVQLGATAGNGYDSETKQRLNGPELSDETSSISHGCLTTESDNSDQPCSKTTGKVLGAQYSCSSEANACRRSSQQDHGTNTDPTPESTDSEVQVTIMNHKTRPEHNADSDEVTLSNDIELLTRKLLCAIESRDLRCAVELLKAGADPSLAVDGVSPLHLAAGMSSSLSFHFTRLFLEHGADPNVRSVDGLTPVHVAAMWGRIECLKLLLNCGGNPYEADEQGMTAVDLAKTFEEDTSADTSEYLSKMDEHYSSLINASFSSVDLLSEPSQSELRYVPYLYEEEKNEHKIRLSEVEGVSSPSLSPSSPEPMPKCGVTWSRTLKKKLSLRGAARKFRKSSSRLFRRLSNLRSFLSTSSSQ